jgi:hypothetical protein
MCAGNGGFLRIRPSRFLRLAVPSHLYGSDRAATDAFNQRARAFLTKSINLGIYQQLPY